MDPRKFVESRRDRWLKLSESLDQMEGRGWRRLSAAQLREVGVLYRYVAADLSRLRTIAPRSSWVERLNQLVLRAHSKVYQSPRATWKERLTNLYEGPPRAVQKHQHSVYAAGLLLMIGTMIGGLLTLGDPFFADFMMGSEFANNVREGRYWIEELFSVIPHGVAASYVLTNNLGVCLLTYATGISGIFPTFVMVMNGMSFGAVLALTAQNGLFSRTIGFVSGHGVIELSAVVVAGGAGFAIFEGWLSPRTGSRAQGVAQGAIDGAWMLMAAFVGLLIAGPIEGFLSPLEQIPVLVRVLLGCVVGAVFWVWLLMAGRRQANPAADTET